MNRTTAALFGVGIILVLFQIILDDLIIRDVCRRERRSYPFLWPYSPYWQMRIFKRAWLEEARSAGLYEIRTAAFAAFVVCVALTAASAMMAPRL